MLVRAGSMSVASSAGPELSYCETQLSLETPSHTKQIILPSAGALILLLSPAAASHGLPTVGSRLSLPICSDFKGSRTSWADQPDCSMF